MDNNKKKKYGEYKHVLLTDNELEKLKQNYANYLDLIKYLDEYIEMKGYKAKNHYLAIKKWVINAVEEKNKKQIKKEELPEWFNKNYKEEIDEERRKEIEAIKNGTYGT